MDNKTKNDTFLLIIRQLSLVSRLSKKLVLVESERSELHQRVSDVKDNYRDVKAKHDAALVDGAVKMEVEDHLAATSRLKRALEDEQNKNTTTLENLQTKIVVGCVVNVITVPSKWSQTSS